MSVPRSDQLLESLVWSDKTYSLAEFVETFELPQVVRIEVGLSSQSESTSLDVGQVVVLHCLQKTRSMVCETAQHNAVAVPFNCSLRFLVQPKSKDCNYTQVSSDQFDSLYGRVKYFQVLKGTQDSRCLSKSLKVGEILKIKDVNNKRAFAKFKNVNTKQKISIPFECGALFSPLLDYREYNLAEIREKFGFPVKVRRSKQNSDGQFLRSSLRNSLNSICAPSGFTVFGEIEQSVLLLSIVGEIPTEESVHIQIPKNYPVEVSIAEGFLQGEQTYHNIVEFLDKQSKTTCTENFQNFDVLQEVATERDWQATKQSFMFEQVSDELDRTLREFRSKDFEDEPIPPLLPRQSSQFPCQTQPSIVIPPKPNPKPKSESAQEKSPRLVFKFLNQLDHFSFPKLGKSLKPNDERSSSCDELHYEEPVTETPSSESDFDDEFSWSSDSSFHDPIYDEPYAERSDRHEDNFVECWANVEGAGTGNIQPSTTAVNVKSTGPQLQSETDNKTGDRGLENPVVNPTFGNAQAWWTDRDKKANCFQRPGMTPVFDKTPPQCLTNRKEENSHLGEVVSATHGESHQTVGGEIPGQTGPSTKIPPKTEPKPKPKPKPKRKSKSESAQRKSPKRVFKIFNQLNYFSDSKLEKSAKPNDKRSSSCDELRYDEPVTSNYFSDSKLDKSAKPNDKRSSSCDELRYDEPVTSNYFGDSKLDKSAKPNDKRSSSCDELHYDEPVIETPSSESDFDDDFSWSSGSSFDDPIYDEPCAELDVERSDRHEDNFVECWANTDSTDTANVQPSTTAVNAKSSGPQLQLKTDSKTGDSGLKNPVVNPTFGNAQARWANRETLVLDKTPPQLQTNHNEEKSVVTVNRGEPPKKSIAVIPQTDFLGMPSRGREARTDTTTCFAEDLSGLTLEDVGELLTMLHMDCYIRTFEEEMVDGELFKSMDEEAFESLGVKSFHIKKLMKFIGGWRPRI